MDEKFTVVVKNDGRITRIWINNKEVSTNYMSKAVLTILPRKLPCLTAEYIREEYGD